MAIRLVTKYSKRLGLPNFSSHSFEVSVETEVQSLADAESEMHQLYHQLQQNVDAQIQETGFVPPDNYGASQQRKVNPPARQPQRYSSQEGWRCSEKQEKFIRRLMSENQLALKVVDTLAQQRFGKPAQQLNKMQASGLIDALLDQYGNSPRGNGQRGGRS